MNKRFFTLMAAVLLTGAPLSGVFAVESNPTITYEQVDANKKLATGVKFYLKATVTAVPEAEEVEGEEETEAADYLTVSLSGDKTYYTIGAEKVTEDKATLFEIKNYSNKTFQLYANGKKVCLEKTEDGKTAVLSTFYAVKSDGSVTEKLDFNNILAYQLGTTGISLVDGSTLTAMTQKTVFDAASLNANLSGKGFKFNFPNATSQPDVNPFAQQMVAVSANEVKEALFPTPATRAADPITLDNGGLMFAIANDKGLELLKGVTADRVKAATFVVVNPLANFDITGFTIANGEGYDFTTIKGDKLADGENVKKDGKIAYQNGVYSVTETDGQNAADDYVVKVKPYLPTSTSEGVELSDAVYVGAYSLTGAGLKTYITTKSSLSKLSLASTAGTTYAQASDLLNTKGAAVYNISFKGTRPTNNTEAEASFYGKYLVSENAVDDNTAYFDIDADAPADANLTAAQYQWVVTSYDGKGQVTFTNFENDTQVKATLYTTDEEGVFEVSKMTTADGTPISGVTEKIVLTVPEAVESFLTLTDAQLKQGIEFTFTGEGSVTADDIYMYIDEEEQDDDTVIYPLVPTTDARYSQVWTLKKASSVQKKEIPYVYLKDKIVTEGTVDSLKIQTYYLTSGDYALKDMNDNAALTNYQLVKVEGATKGDEFAFKKVGDHYVMVCLASAAESYDDIVTEDMAITYVSTKNSKFGGKAISKIKDSEVPYAAVSINLYTMGESLPAVARHATIDSEDGAISMKENKNGVLEGIIASEGMTFWLDTADSKADFPTFYLSKGIAAAEGEAPATKADEAPAMRNFLFVPSDSAKYWSDNDAAWKTDAKYYLEGTNKANLKAIFRPAALVGIDTLNTVAGGKEVVVTKDNGLNNFKFYITKATESEYMVTSKSTNEYLYNLNGKLGFTGDYNKALIITLGEGDATANEAIAAESGVQVIGGQGVVTVQGAAGKVITVANILGQTIANQVAASDNVTIAVPAGIVVVAVDGEATKVVVK